MSRTSNYPVLLNECKILTIGYLLRRGYLSPHSYNSGQVAWYREECNRCEGLINIIVKMDAVAGDVRLEYMIDKQYICYNVRIISKPSNIGIGKVYYFICPFTDLKCKNLYLINGLFVHRTYFKNCLYVSQTYSYNIRQIKKCIDVIRNHNLIQETKEKRYFKGRYRGKITRPLLRVLLKKERLHRRCNDEFRHWAVPILEDKIETYALIK